MKIRPFITSLLMTTGLFFSNPNAGMEEETEPYDATTIDLSKLRLIKKLSDDAYRDYAISCVHLLINSLKNKNPLAHENNLIKIKKTTTELLKPKPLYTYNLTLLLHHTIEYNNEEPEALDAAYQLAELLLDMGANPDTQDYENGDTAIHLAIKLDKMQLVRLLVSRNADLAISNDEEQKPEDWIYHDDKCNITLLQLLYKHDVAYKTAIEDSLNNDLRCAVLTKNLPEVTLLTELHPEEIFREDDWGVNIEHIALETSNDEIFVFLRLMRLKLESDELLGLQHFNFWQ